MLRFEIATHTYNKTSTVCTVKIYEDGTLRAFLARPQFMHDITYHSVEIQGDLEVAIKVFKDTGLVLQYLAVLGHELKQNDIVRIDEHEYIVSHDVMYSRVKTLPIILTTTYTVVGRYVRVPL